MPQRRLNQVYQGRQRAQEDAERNQSGLGGVHQTATNQMEEINAMSKALKATHRGARSNSKEQKSTRAPSPRMCCVQKVEPTETLEEGACW